jgi:hypothetical protein
MQQTATSYDLRSLFGYYTFTTAVILYVLAYLIPVIKLLRRTGHNIAWCLLALIPGLNLIAFWVFVFKPWPKDGRMPDSK